MLANTYSPRSLVTVLRLMFVRSLVSVTSTPGMTPPASLIDPRTPPWKPCPKTVPEATTARNAPMSAARILIVPPSDDVRRTEVRQRVTGRKDAINPAKKNAVVWGDSRGGRRAVAIPGLPDSAHGRRGSIFLESDEVDS